jgi:hypothetical protein
MKKKTYELNKGNFFKSMHNRQNKEMAKKHVSSVKARKKINGKKK